MAKETTVAISRSCILGVCNPMAADVAVGIVVCVSWLAAVMDAVCCRGVAWLVLLLLLNAMLAVRSVAAGNGDAVGAVLWF